MIPSDCSVGFISPILFTSGYICDSIFSLWQEWSKVEGVLCVEWNYWLLPYISFSLSESETRLSPDISSEISEYLKILQASIREYSPIYKERCELARISALSLDGVSGPTAQSNRTPYWHGAWRKLNRHFKTESVFEFWYLRRSEYPEIANHAVQPLLSFGSTYRCEAAFSEQPLTEKNQRNRLDPWADVRVRLSYINPDFRNWYLELHAQFNGESKMKDQF